MAMTHKLVLVCDNRDCAKTCTITQEDEVPALWNQVFYHEFGGQVTHQEFCSRGCLITTSLRPEVEIEPITTYRIPTNES